MFSSVKINSIKREESDSKTNNSCCDTFLNLHQSDSLSDFMYETLIEDSLIGSTASYFNNHIENNMNNNEFNALENSKKNEQKLFTDSYFKNFSFENFDETFCDKKNTETIDNQIFKSQDLFINQLNNKHNFITNINTKLNLEKDRFLDHKNKLPYSNEGFDLKTKKINLPVRTEKENLLTYENQEFNNSTINSPFVNGFLQNNVSISEQNNIVSGPFTKNNDLSQENLNSSYLDFIKTLPEIKNFDCFNYNVNNDNPISDNIIYSPTELNLHQENNNNIILFDPFESKDPNNLVYRYENYFVQNCDYKNINLEYKNDNKENDVNKKKQKLERTCVKKKSDDYLINEVLSKTLLFKRYPILRGISSGSCTTRPPRHLNNSDSVFIPVQLNIVGASVEDICYPQWSELEANDYRRIVRIERIQSGSKLFINFSIIGSAVENPLTIPSLNPNIDVLEVSCLRCVIKDNDDSLNDHFIFNNHKNKKKSSSLNEHYEYFITSVEVIEIVELFIGTYSKNPVEKRKERGRVRSNLVPYWSKKPISTRMNNSSNSNSFSDGNVFGNTDYRVELAKRIMGYGIRKPRGFDKEVRILEWDKLVPALKRALQSYYTEIPEKDAQFNV